jgi:hypothetical protein
MYIVTSTSDYLIPYSLTCTLHISLLSAITYYLQTINHLQIPSSGAQVQVPQVEMQGGFTNISKSS